MADSDDRHNGSAPAETKEVDKLRRVIDKTDEQLLALFNERARLAQQIGRQKQSSGASVFYCPEREAQIVSRMLRQNPGPLPDAAVDRIFRELMSACLALQQPLRVAYLGPEGTFTHAATVEHFGHALVAVSQASIDRVFYQVSSRDCDYGVVPIENSTEGVVTHTLDMFIESSLLICGEVQLPVHHHLLATEPKLSGIRRLYSHQQSFAQCRNWLDSKLPGAERFSVNSNAEAAQKAATASHAGAIASAAAAELYSLPIRASNIEDNPDNTTRFLIIGRRPVAPSGNDKTTLLFSVAHRAGALHRALSCFVSHRINMTRIESRPSRQGVWEYVFFVDVLGHADEEPLRGALKELREAVPMLKLLGSYPQQP